MHLSVLQIAPVRWNAPSTICAFAWKSWANVFLPYFT